MYSPFRLYKLRKALTRVRMSPIPFFKQSDRMVASAVWVSVSLQIPVSFSAFTDDYSAGFDPGTNYSHQGVSGSIRNRHEKGLSGLQFETAKDLLSFHGVFPLVLATELAFVDFDSLVRTADLLRYGADGNRFTPPTLPFESVTMLVSTHHIWEPHKLRTKLLRISPTSLRNYIPTYLLMKRRAKNKLSTTSFPPRVARSYKVDGTNGMERRRCWYEIILVLL